MGTTEQADPIARGLGDSALLVLGSVLAAGLGFVTLRLLLTGLSEDDYGRYGLLQQVAGLLAVLVGWSVPAVLRLGADEVEARGTVGRTLGTLGALTFTGALIAAVLGGVVAPRITASLPRLDVVTLTDGRRVSGEVVASDEARVVVAVAGAAGRREEVALERARVATVTRAQRGGGGALAAWVVLSALVTGAAGMSAALLAPLGLVRWRTLVPVLSRALFAAMIVAAVARGSLDLTAALALGAVSTLPAVLIPLLAARPRVGRLEVDPAVARRAALFAWPLVLRSLAVTGLVAIDPFVLRWWWPDTWPAAVARYDVAYRLAEQVIVFGFVLEFVGGPLLATAAARGEAGTPAVYLRRFVPPLALAWGLGTALVLALGEALLVVLGAPRPAESARLLELLLLGVAIRGVTTLENPLLDAHLVSRWPTAFVAIALALNLLLDVLFLALGLGVVAPALATLLAFAAHAALRAAYAGRVFGQTTWRAHAALLPALLVLVVGRAVDIAVAGPVLPTGATTPLAAWLAPAEGAGAWGVVARLVALAVVAPLVVMAARRTGLLDPALARDLERVRMPARLRALLVALVGEPPPPGPGTAAVASGSPVRDASDPRRRLLLLITELHPAGAERVVFDLATRLDRRAWRVVVASLASPGGDDGAVHRALVAAGVEVVALRARGKLDPGAAWRLFTLVRALRPHVLHAHLAHANLAARLVGRLAGAGAVVSTHHVVERRALPLRLALERLTARLDDRTVAVSPAVADFARRRLGAPRARLRTVDNGVDLARARSGGARDAARAALGLPLDAELVGAVGRLSAQKGVDLLVRAFAQVAPRRPRAHLALAGAGEEERALRALVVSLGLAGRVTLLGFRDDVPRVLAALDLFAMPSRWEGFGLALVEAMAAGKPCVVAAVDSLPAVLGDAGRLVPPDDVPALAAAIEALLADPAERARLAALAEVRAARFSVDAMVAGHAAVYDELPGAARPSRRSPLRRTAQ